MSGMGVDGIGKGGVPPVGPEGIEPAEAPAGASVTEAPTPTSKPAEGSDALQALQRGEIDRTQYLDARVGGAVAHLEGRLPPEQLDAVRRAVREQLETDPVLAELVRRATLGSPQGTR